MKLTPLQKVTVAGALRVAADQYRVGAEKLNDTEGHIARELVRAADECDALAQALMGASPIIGKRLRKHAVSAKPEA